MGDETNAHSWLCRAGEGFVFVGDTGRIRDYCRMPAVSINYPCLSRALRSYTEGRVA